jgi:hypothetical protein
MSGIDPAWGYVSPGESRWPSAFAVGAIIALQLVLPEKLTVGPSWAVPSLELLLMVTLIIGRPNRLDAESRDLRVVALSLTAVLIAADGSTLALLLRSLLRENANLNGRTLIYSAVAVWFTAVVAFGLWYWEIDRGGPIRRCSIDHAAPDFLFPQMQEPASTAGEWTPKFADYLYLSLTNSTAFSPTDTLPLTVRAKAIMALQSLSSLATIVVVGARAVNILR